MMRILLLFIKLMGLLNSCLKVLSPPEGPPECSRLNIAAPIITLERFPRSHYTVRLLTEPRFEGSDSTMVTASSKETSSCVSCEIVNNEVRFLLTDGATFSNDLE